MPALNLEKRLYEALRLGKGIRLSAEDVEDLIAQDDAIQKRIMNVIANGDGWQLIPYGVNMPTLAELRSHDSRKSEAGNGSSCRKSEHSRGQ